MLRNLMQPRMQNLLYVVDGVIHHCVANMPGAVARTSTFALNNSDRGHAVAFKE